MDRPDLTNVDAGVVAYIEWLEAQGSGRAASADTPLSPSEPPTPQNVITVTASGLAKRTSRHLYGRQRRGGMGVFDIESAEDDPPAIVTVADENSDLIAVTSEGRVFRFPVAKLTQTAVRGRGEPIADHVQLLEDEQIVSLLAAGGGSYLTLVSERGWVRHVRDLYLGANMVQGIRYHKTSDGGLITHACWSDGVADLFIATRRGKAIRFAERQIPGSGCLGIRLDPDDTAIAVTATMDDGSVFLLREDGKGTVRSMTGFRKNKAPGAGGKVAMKTDHLIGAAAVSPGDDVLIVSRLGKMVRFAADEIPVKTGVVQGVNCMGLRNDEVAAFAVSSAATQPQSADE